MASYSERNGTTLLTGATDPDGDPVTVATVNGSAANVGVPIPLAGGGLVTVSAAGVVTLDDSGLQPPPAQMTVAVGSFTFTLTDGQRESPSYTATISVAGAATDEAPVNLTPPAIVGSARIGSTLTASSGTWSGNPAPGFAYQWRRNSSNIAGATGQTYQPGPADDGTAIRVMVTATNGAGSATALSAPVNPVWPTPLAGGGLADVTYAAGSGVQVVDASVDFTNAAGGSWSLAAAPAGVTISQAGLVSIPTDNPIPASSVVVRYANSGGSAESGFSVTVTASNGAPLGSDLTLRFDVAAGTAADTDPPALLAMTPAAGATDVPVDTAIALTFSEPVIAGSGSIALHDVASAATIAAIDIAAAAITGDTVTIQPPAPLPAGRQVAVRIPAGAITDAAGNAFPGIADDALAFSTAAQGSGGAGFLDLSTSPNVFATSAAVTSPAVQASAGRVAVAVLLQGGQLPRATAVTIGGVAATLRGARASGQVELSFWEADLPAGNSGTISASSASVIADYAVAAWSVDGLAWQSTVSDGGNQQATSFALATTAPAGAAILTAAASNAGWSFAFSGAVEAYDMVVDGRGVAGATTFPASGNDTVTVTTSGNFADCAFIAAVYA
ncbi:MAG: hypothetical protein D6686_05295 [Alphaproteobacteria bacterium]|nr:MAG: hypothetical protein D6686_05295 [Alphaproteobacteria bacterium]